MTMLLAVFLGLLQVTSLPRTVGKGETSRIDEARQVTVRTAPEWDVLWRAHAPGQARPPVDFSQEMVVGVFLGSRPTAGYGVQIVRAVFANGRLLVEYVVTSPALDIVTPQIITAPYHLVAIPRRDGDVTFERVQQ